MQVALPIMFTILLAVWINGRGFDALNKRLDDVRNDMSHLREDMNNRFGDVNRRLDRIDETLKIHSGKIAGLEERTSPLARR